MIGLFFKGNVCVTEMCRGVDTGGSGCGIRKMPFPGGKGIFLIGIICERLVYTLELEGNGQSVPHVHSLAVHTTRNEVWQ